MDDDNAADKFCEEDIDSILERRTTTVTVEGNKAGRNTSWVTKVHSQLCCSVGHGKAKLHIIDLKNTHQFIARPGKA